VSRPEIYKHLMENQIYSDRYLASAEIVYGLAFENEWLIQVKPKQYAYQPIRKYYRHFYSSLGQARVAQQKLATEYGIEPDIVEISVNDLQID
jgi:hypothetical protein